MTGSSGQPLTVSGHQYYVKLPTGYDPDKPYPVVIGLHPTGQDNKFPWAENNLGFEKNGAKDAAIRVYPQCANLSNGWNASDVSFFQPLHETVLANFCVDKNRVFVTGESSGGDFASIVGCEHGDIIRATGPCATKAVNEYPINNPGSRTCKGQVDAVVIHGINDMVVGPANGPATAEYNPLSYYHMQHLKARKQLGDFLRAQRDRLRPEDFGLPTGQRRRAPGLRREEAAQLCGISPTWFTWIEQGRTASVSVPTLAAIARGLHLSRAERAYLFELASRADPAPPTVGPN